MNCREIADDIFKFASLLVEANIINDAKSLYKASSKLLCYSDSSQWKYECDNIKFSVKGVVAGSIPQKISLTEIIFSISIAGNFSSEEFDYINPLSSLKFDIEIEGYRDEGGKIDNFFASWHLDKNIPSPTPSYIHPEYHLTFGGNKLEEKGVDNFGSTLILPSPRISYPPMDVILGIDFILQNYFPLNEIKKLIDKPEYTKIITNSQLRLWKPYYNAISAAWDSPCVSFEKGFEYFDLNPHIFQQ